jgi:hypothetical protein
MRARNYNPYLCRFVSADPSGFAGGLNAYAYANGNPISYLDPFGLDAVNESTANSSLANNSENSAPNMVGTILPNVNLIPNLSEQGTLMSMDKPYYDASQPATAVWSIPGDVNFQQNLSGAAQGANMILSVASLMTPAGDLSAADHIVLGIEDFGLADTAAQVGGRTLMGDSEWTTTLQAALGNSSTRFTVSLDGVSGVEAGTQSQVMSLVQSGVTPAATPFQWEMGQLYQSGRLGEVNFVRGGQIIQNPFLY